MDKVDVKSSHKYLEEYCKLCSNECGESNCDSEYIASKINKILNGDKVISVLGLVDKDDLIGFISLFKYDGDERTDLSPWYATMYVKEEYRGKGYSKILNEMIQDEASKLGFKRIYLKTDLVNYYEKFGAKYIEDLECGERLYYLDV